jgi:tRNA pseudouridine55 synthase
MIPLLSRTTADPNAWRSAASEVGGIILVDKQQGWTSFDVVAKLRRLLRIKKVGHAGTLDPMATGLLIVCVGKGTRHVSEFQALDKEYQVEIKLGARTPSDDAETPEQDHQPIDHLSGEDIQRAVASFVGTIEQIPPSYSAVHVGGKRLYTLARSGKELPPLPPRSVTIHAITNIELMLPYVRFCVHCSKGTYIRSLARDIGNVLGVGAYVTALRRTAIGPYRVGDAFTITELSTMFQTASHADISPTC